MEATSAAVNAAQKVPLRIAQKKIPIGTYISNTDVKLTRVMASEV